MIFLSGGFSLNMGSVPSFRYFLLTLNTTEIKWIVRSFRVRLAVSSSAYWLWLMYICFANSLCEILSSSRTALRRCCIVAFFKSNMGIVYWTTETGSRLHCNWRDNRKLKWRYWRIMYLENLDYLAYFTIDMITYGLLKCSYSDYLGVCYRER